MTVSLGLSQYPSGTQIGSPIQEVGTYTTWGNSEWTTALPIPDNALPGDVVLVFFGAGTAQSGAGFYSSLIQTPAGFFTLPGGWNLQSSSLAGWAQLSLLWHVVQPGEAGLVATIAWSSVAVMSWQITMRTYRYVDTAYVFDTSGAFTQTGFGGTGTTSNTGWGSTNFPNDLLVFAMQATAGTSIGINPGPLPDVFSIVQNNGQVPYTGMVSGIRDLPQATYFNGVGCGWLQNNAGVGISWCGITIPLKPIPIPSAPTNVTLSPNASTIDAAQVSGTPFTVSWIWSPVQGQGPQSQFLIARQTHGGSDQSFWNADLNTWSASEYWNVGTGSTYAFPVGSWSNDGTTWDVYVGVKEGALNLKSALSSVVTFTAQSPPSVSPVTVTNPTLPSPTINWTVAGLALSDPSHFYGWEDGTFQGWVANNGVLVTNFGGSHSGQRALWYAWSTQLAPHFAISPTGTSGTPITGSQPGTVIAWLRSCTVPRALYLQINFYTSTGAFISQVNTTVPAAANTSAWTQATLPFTSPSGAAYYSLQYGPAYAGAAGEWYAIDDAAVILGVAQTGYRAKFFYLADTLAPGFNPNTWSPAAWDSGALAGAGTSATPGTALPTANADYVAYAQITQTGGQTSPWTASAPFWNNVSPITPATLVAVAGADPNCYVPRNRVTTTGLPGGYVLHLQSSDDQVTQINWADVRGSPFTPSSGAVTAYDYEMIPNATRYYRARLESISGNARSDWSAIVGATSTFKAFALVDPLNPQNSLVLARTIDSSSTTVQTGNPGSASLNLAQPELGTITAALGRTRKIASRAQILGREFTLNLYLATPAQRAAWEALRATQRVLLIQTDLTPGEHYYVNLDVNPGETLMRTWDRRTNPQWFASCLVVEADPP
jgi:hypothetical protein